MKSEFVITNGEKFIRCDIDGRYKQVKNLSLAEIYEDKKTALNIVKNSLPKKLAYKYYVAQVVDGEILQNTMPKPPTAKTSKTEAVYDFKTDMSQTEWYEGFIGLDGVFSEAIKRTAYTAQSAGTSLDDLIAYITTISEKTRLAPEKIGNGLKSIYSRYENIKLGNLDDEGKSINDTEKALGRIGIKIREDAGTFRDFGSVLDEFIAKIKEGKISQIDMLSGVQALGGTYNRDVLLSLIQNVDTLKQIGLIDGYLLGGLSLKPDKLQVFINKLEI